MAEREGVIKFQLEFSSDNPPSAEEISEINAWRKILYHLELIGQDPRRYDGYGFGNISKRLNCSNTASCEVRFLISGTQTGDLAELTTAHYSVVEECDPERNRIVAKGPIPPSSESLTHGTLYALDESIRFVMHVHSPHLWSAAEALGIPSTRPEILYGTPEMAEEVRRLCRTGEVRSLGIFSMGGHEDGIVSFGKTAEEAGAVLINYLAKAYVLSNGTQP